VAALDIPQAHFAAFNPRPDGKAAFATVRRGTAANAQAIDCS